MTDKIKQIVNTDIQDITNEGFREGFDYQSGLRRKRFVQKKKQEEAIIYTPRYQIE